MPLDGNAAFRGLMFGLAISAPVWVVLWIIVTRCVSTDGVGSGRPSGLEGSLGPSKHS